MNLFDFLLSPAGQELTHAFVLLAVAIAGWITYQTRRQALANAHKLDDHIEQHEVGIAHTTPGGVVDDTNNI